MPTPSPIIVVMLSTKMLMGVIRVSSPIAVSDTAMARTPTMSGSAAATSAPKASTRMKSVRGSSVVSPRRLSSATTVRTSRSSGARPVTRARYWAGFGAVASAMRTARRVGGTYAPALSPSITSIATSTKVASRSRLRKVVSPVPG